MTDASASDLLRQCLEAREAGRDFPTIWNVILKRHPLVEGLPRQEIRGGEAVIIVELLSGHRLASSTRGFELI